MEVRKHLIPIITFLFYTAAISAEVEKLGEQVRMEADNLNVLPIKSDYAVTISRYLDYGAVEIVEEENGDVVFEERGDNKPHIQNADGSSSWPQQNGQVVDIDGRKFIKKDTLGHFTFWEKGDAVYAEFAHESGALNRYIWVSGISKQLRFSGKKKELVAAIDKPRDRPNTVLPFIPSYHAKTIARTDELDVSRIREVEDGVFEYVASDSSGTMQFSKVELPVSIAYQQVNSALADGGRSEIHFTGIQEFQGFPMPESVTFFKFNRNDELISSRVASNIIITRGTEEEFSAVAEQYHGYLN